jgi:proline iminopeptidase
MKADRSTFVLASVSLALVVAVFCSSFDVRLGMGQGEGVKLSYRSLGKGLPLFVIHDGPGLEKSLMYAGFDRLASDLQVVYYDQRGCGASPALTPLEPSSVQANVDDIEALRRYFRLPRVALAGQGWGAVLAMEYALKYGKYVDSMILVAPLSPLTPGPRLERLLDSLSPEQEQTVYEITANPTMSLVEKRERMMRAVMPLLFYRKEAMKYVNLAGTRYAPEVNIRTNEDLKSLDILGDIQRVEVPTLVVVGRHDVFTPMTDQMVYADGISGSCAVVFNNSGHFPFLEERNLFLNVARGFLLHGELPTLVSAGRR